MYIYKHIYIYIYTHIDIHTHTNTRIIRCSSQLVNAEHRLLTAAEPAAMYMCVCKYTHTCTHVYTYSSFDAHHNLSKQDTEYAQLQNLLPCIYVYV